jgi:radical SAM superfamily enzyme YgiQ (UPF0313 family)
MKVSFITSGQESLGVEALSAYLKRNNHQVRLFFDPQTFGGSIFLRVNFLKKIFDLKEKIISEVIQWEPDLIGFSCMVHNYQWSLEIAREIRKRAPSLPIIFGGIQPTSMADEVLENDCVDMVAIGEAELSLTSLLENMENGSVRTDIKGIYFKKDGRIIKNPVHSLVKDLDSLPFKDKDIFFDKIPGFIKKSYSIMASKGCPFSCTYCCNEFLKNLYKGDKFCRKRSVDHVIRELKEAKQKYNFRMVHFYDEIFPSELSWLREFTKRYKQEIGVPFQVYYHAMMGTEERIKLMKEAGCWIVFFGLQSASDKVRRDVCNRFYTNEEIESFVKLCRKYDIQVSIDHILGFPDETPEHLKEAADFYRKISPDIIYSFWLTYYPKTKIIYKALESNLLTEEDMKKINSGEKSFFYAPAFVKNKKDLVRYQTLFDLIPLMSAKMHKRFSDNAILVKILPYGYFTHFFLVFLAGFKLKYNIFADTFKLLFSRKFVP